MLSERRQRKVSAFWIILLIQNSRICKLSYSDGKQIIGVMGIVMNEDGRLGGREYYNRAQNHWDNWYVHCAPNSVGGYIHIYTHAQICEPMCVWKLIKLSNCMLSYVQFIVGQLYLKKTVKSFGSVL